MGVVALVLMALASCGIAHPDTRVTTMDAEQIGQVEATLSGMYSAAATTPSETGFYWGTSAGEIKEELYVDSGSGKSGSFSKTLSSLEPGTTYYFRAYIIVKGDYYYGEVKSFTTRTASGGGQDKPHGIDGVATWLSGYEIPATNVSVSASDVLYEDRYCHSTVNEKTGGTKACIYNTPEETRIIVTHTFSYNGKVLPNYTLYYDKDMHCALWAAFVMGGNDYPDKNVGRNESWTYDPAIPQSWQPGLSSAYQNSYTRGHAIASNYRQTTVDQNKQTFYYSNMTPQTSGLNNGAWNTLENAVAKVAGKTTGNDRLYVVTGPIFEEGYETTKDKSGLECPVPTKYYKCLMLCTFNADGTMATAKGSAYVYNHKGDTARQDKTIDEVEKMTGFDFFTNVPDALETEAEKISYNFF